MSVRLLLHALGHPSPDAALDDDMALGRCVAWLEDTKVRALPPDSRQPLRDVTAATWETAFAQYLAHTGCPLPPQPRLPAVLWLASQAVALEYRDRVASHGDEGGAGDGEEALLLAGVKDDPHLWSDVLAAAAALRVRTAGDAHGSTHSMPAVVDDAVGVATADALAAAAQRLAWLAAVAPDERAKIASSAAEAADIDGAFPLGFELDDQSLARPAALLRARHVAHLRALQSRVDAALVAAQECTADPRTDARLGRVGR